MNLQALKKISIECEKMGMVYKWAGVLDFILIIFVLSGNLWIPALYLISKGVLFLTFISRKCVISMMDIIMAIFLFISNFSEQLTIPLIMYLLIKVFLALI